MVSPSELQPSNLKFQFDSATFFIAAKDFCINALDGDWGSALNTFLTGIKTGFSNDESPEYRACLLLNNTLASTIKSILSDDPNHLKIVNELANEKTRKKNYTKKLLAQFKKIEVSIDPDFFDTPHTHTFTKEIRSIFRNWLIQYLQFSEHQADALSSTLPYRFTHHLSKEWSGNEQFYEALKTWKDNPFFQATKKIQQQNAYKAKLLGNYARSAFDDPRIALSEMYQKPFFRIHKRCIVEEKEKKFYENDNASSLERQDEFLKPKLDKNIHEYLLSWICDKTPIGLEAEQQHLTLLLGQPGQGKTSFCYYTIHQLLDQYQGKKEHVYFVKLKEITNFEDLIKEPIEVLSKFISKKLYEENKVMEVDNWKDALLILDGLDELCMNKSLSKDQVHNFLENLNTNLQTDANYKWKAIVTSRYNYVNLNELSGSKFLILRLDELSLEQQKDWLSKYKKYYPDAKLDNTKLETINEGNEKQHQELKKLLNQPILLQIIAKANYDIDEKANRSKIYKSLFDSILERKWDDESIRKFKRLTPYYRRFLRILALHIYQSEHEYDRRSDFERANTELNKIVDKIKEKSDNKSLSIQDLVKDLLVNFYFQEVSTESEDQKRIEENENFAFEFLHKSLQEYLVAEHIWETIKSKLFLKDEEDYIIDDARGMLQVIYPLFSTKFLSQEVLDYIREIAVNEEKDKVFLMKERLSSLFPKLLAVDFFIKDQFEGNALFDAVLSVFHGFWTVYSATFEIKKLPSPLNDYDAYKTALQEALNSSLSNLNSIKFAHFITLLQRLHPLSLVLSHQDLSGAYLNGAYLRGADLRGAYLRGAYLRGADLRGA
ncbi:MAG: pentapeptide repeat-containing protein, partial [Bacteroidota bacterium]